MENIIESLKIANKLRLREGDQQQQAAQPQQQQPAADQNSGGGAGGVDQAQLEKAFEAALQNIKGEIVQEVQGLMEKFGETLVQKIGANGGSGEGDSSSNSKDNGGNDQQQSSSSNNGGDNNNGSGDNNNQQQEENK